ncbi:MAG: DUF1858 domain-containing protein [Bellilinea sp.]|nr:DUF1858 domain-containing protein [Bellilinea sp.]
MNGLKTILHPDTQINELLRQYPQTASVFFRHQMVCVGCWMSKFDTIADAVWNYGLDLENFLAELSASTESPNSSKNQPSR